MYQDRNKRTKTSSYENINNFKKRPELHNHIFQLFQGFNIFETSQLYFNLFISFFHNRLRNLAYENWNSCSVRLYTIICKYTTINNSRHWQQRLWNPLALKQETNTGNLCMPLCETHQGIIMWRDFINPQQHLLTSADFLNIATRFNYKVLLF